MRNYKQPTIDPYRAFCEIVNCKRQPKQDTLRLISHKVRARFDEYRAFAAILTSIASSTFDSDQKEVLLDCYTDETNPRNAMLAAIKKSQPTEIIGQCQYCGIGCPETFDHYLPKADFPEFSAFTLNLLPCCHICNSKKSNVFLINGQRQIINLYFDSPPATQFLFAQIRYEHNTPIAEFTLVRHNAITEDEFELIKAHYKRLDLRSRFRARAPEVFSETKSFIQEHEKILTSCRVRDWLHIEANRLARRYSVNYWKSVLYLAMSQDKQFISGCCAPNNDLR